MNAFELISFETMHTRCQYARRKEEKRQEKYQNALTVKGRTVQLLSMDDCVRQYNFKPGTVLHKSTSGPLIVIGLGQDNNLWVQDSLHQKPPYPLESIHGYSIIAKKCKRSDKKEINDEEDVVNRVSKLFKTQTDCDVHFEVGGKRIGGHRALLKASSPYFQTLLGGQFKESQTIHIEIKDCEAEDFEAVMEYLYSGHIHLNRENILMIAHLAHLFAIQSLETNCQNALSQFLRCTNPLSCPYALILNYVQLILDRPHCLESLILSAFYQQIEKTMTLYESTVEIIAKLKKEHLLYLIQNCPEKLKPNLFKLFIIWIEHTQHLQPEEVVDLFLPFSKNCESLFIYAKILSDYIKEVPDSQKPLETYFQTSMNQELKMVYAQALALRKQTATAEGLFKQVLDVVPHHVFALSCYALILQQLERNGAAAACFGKALAQESDKAFVLCFYAQALQGMKMPRAAADRFEKARALEPNNTFILNRYAETLYQLGQKQLAISKFEEVLVLDPQNNFALKRKKDIEVDSRIFKLLHVEF